ncbi:MAG TPA: TonB family protein [Steroidobacteraceae bacterium]|jgi:protein TonB|nr:TonB family protein [Steroidobacteraceae bacterium]
MAENLLLLTHDESLIEALTGVVAPGTLISVRDEAALAGQLMSVAAGVVFIDAGEGAAQAALTAQLTQRLHGQLPDVVLVVAGDGAAQSELASLIADGTIYRFVHKPVSAQRVKLFVDAAWRKRDGTSSGSSGLYQSLSMSQTLPILPMPRPVPWLGITAAAAVVGVALLWHAVNSPRSAAPPDSEPAPALSSAPAVAAALPSVAAPAPPAAESPAHATEQVRVIARRRTEVAIGTASLREVPPAASIPVTVSVPASVPDPVPVSAPAAKLLPVVAASAATLTDASNVSTAGGQPTSTPPVSEAKDPLSVAAVILQRVYWVDPEFPEIAREQDLTGFVDLEFMVHADGSVTDVTVLKAQPAGVFEKASVAAVRQWRYRPVERDGIPVDEHARLRLNFGYK